MPTLALMQMTQQLCGTVFNISYNCQLKNCKLPVGNVVSKSTSPNATSSEKRIILEGKKLETVGELCFLGGIEPSTQRDVNRRITLVPAFGRLRNGIFSNRSITIRLNARLYGALILPIVIYCEEAWALGSKEIQSLEFLICAACWLLEVLPGWTDYKISNQGGHFYI